MTHVPPPDARRAAAFGCLPRPLFLSVLLLCALASPRAVHGQSTSAFLACSPGAMQSCAEIRLTALPAGGIGGSAWFEIALRNLGALSDAARPTSLSYLVLGTGIAPAAPGNEVAELATPVALGGAALDDASPWDVFDGGDVIFLSSLTNAGVGNCVGGAPVGGFGQAGRTCGTGQYLSFGFSTPRHFDPAAMSVLSAEWVALDESLEVDNCGGDGACVVTPVRDVSAVPEPATLLLTASGLVMLVAWRRGRAGRPSDMER